MPITASALAPLPVHRPIVQRNLLDAFAQFLRLDVAAGDASADTVRGYKAQVQQWVTWCRTEAIDPAAATTTDIKRYRAQLVERGIKASTIATKLVALRRLYQAAQDHGLRADNPAAGVKPPRDKRPAEDFRYLSEVDLALLFRAVPKDAGIKPLRDRALLALLGLQGLRTVELQRANVEDLEPRGASTVLLVRGKGRDRLGYLRADVAEAINMYLAARSTVVPDDQGTPLIAATGNRTGGRRLSRRSVRRIVDFYLTKIDVKKPGVSNHALRHTCGTLTYKHSRDLRAVQDLLGHADPKTTSRYAHVVDRERNNVAAKVPVTL
jgi:site-specific recombinase XerD